MAWQNVYAEVEATIVVKMDKSDNGLDGFHYREWAEPDMATADIEMLHMFGREWSPAQLIETFGRKGADALLDILVGQTDPNSWQGEDD